MNQEIFRKTKQFEILLLKFPEFRYIGDPILRISTRPVEISEGIVIGKELGDVLIRYRKLVGYGRGLAAPQMGLSKSVFVMYVNDRIQMFINPEIIDRSAGKNYYRELCLSCGMMWGDVKRSSKITMKWVDETGVEKQEKAEGVIARLWQHEYDHLQGIVNLDRVKPGSIGFITSDPLLEKLRDV